jgi:hypothetical protein
MADNNVIGSDHHKAAGASLEVTEEISELREEANHRQQRRKEGRTTFFS